MNKRSISTTLIAVMLAVASPASSEVLDKIVVVINNTFIITQSDVRRERAVQMALGSDPGDDNAITDALVERHLVEEQIAQFREIEVDSDAVNQRLQRANATTGATRDDIRDTIVAEMRRGDFMAQRFQQFIRITDEELRKYFEEVLVPELRRQGVPVPSLEEGMAAVRPNVLAEKITREVEAWLEDLRRRNVIEKISK